MADTTALKNRIRAAIKANDNQEITGPVLQQSLLDIVDELNGATETEASQRQNADSTLQQNINTESQQRQSADSTLSGMINAEKTRAEGAESTLQNNLTQATSQLQTAIRNLRDAGYAFGGVAVTGGVGKVTNTMLANKTITIGSTTKELGETFTLADLGIS